MNTRRRTAMAAVGILGLAALLGACGGGSDGGDSKSTGTTSAGITAKNSANAEQELADTAEAYAQAIIDGDLDAAYDALDEVCRAQFTRSEYVADAAAALDLAKTMGVDMAQAVITDVRVRNVTATSGEVTIQAEVDGVPIDEEDSWEEWVLEDGGWHTTNCGPADDGSTSGSGSTDLGTDPRLEGALTSELGDVIDLGNGLTVVVFGIDSVQLSGGPAVSVSLRAENTGISTLAPNVEVVCATSLDVSIAVAEDSTFEPYGSLPADSYMEGSASIVPPLGRCDTPAWVLITSADDSDYAMKIALPSDVVAAING